MIYACRHLWAMVRNPQLSHRFPKGPLGSQNRFHEKLRRGGLQYIDAELWRFSSEFPSFGAIMDNREDALESSACQDSLIEEELVTGDSRKPLLTML